MADLLDMAYINSLPQPFLGRTRSGWWWPIYDIEVQTGLVRMDVCGKLEVKDVSDFTVFRDDAGVERRADAFYVDANEDERAPVTPGVRAAAPAEPHPCRWFNGKCIDCGRSHGAPRNAGVLGTPNDQQKGGA